MRTGKLISLAILLAAASALAQRVPTPEVVIGHKVGADFKLADWKTIMGYFETIDRASGKIQVRSLGKSTEGREMIVAEISSEENLRNLRKLYDYQEKLHDPRKITDHREEAEILANAKATILVNCSMHASEVAASQMAMELAHDLITGTDKDTLEILDNCVIQLVVSANPDGLDMVRDWYNKTLKTQFEGAPMPWLYQKYVGHDNNRDWWLISQQETINVSRYMYTEGYPTLLYDVHQMGNGGARFFVPPFFDPTNPNIDPLISQSIFMIGGHMATELAAAGKQGVIWKAIYDNWWQGGMRTTPQRHNIVAILTEAASPRTASPVLVRPSQLGGHERGLPTYDRYVNFPDPWPGGEWRLRDVVEYELIACKSLFRLGARYRDMWVRNHLTLSKKQLRVGEIEAPFGWIIRPEQRFPRGVDQLLTSLMRAGVEVHEAAEEIKVGDESFPKGTVVLTANQPYRAHVKDLMEIQVYPDRRVFPGGPAERPYDVAGWTAPLMMGVDAFEATKPITGKLTKINAVPERYRQRMIPVNVRFDGKMPRVALYQPWTASMDEGWTRFVWEQNGVPYTTLRNADMRNLRARFDCIFFPGVSATSILNGISAERTFPEYAGGIGEAGVEALKAFVQEGGTLVLMDDSTGLAPRLGIEITNALRGLDRDQFFCPGSILRTRVDTSHPLAEDLPADSIAYFSSSSAFNIPDGMTNVEVVARYAEDKPLLSGYLLGEQYLEGKPCVVRVKQGRGSVVLLGFPVQYRGQPVATFPYMWNAMRLSLRP